MIKCNLQFFGGRGSGSSMSGGGSVTLTSIPNHSVDNIQKFANQFGTGMSVVRMVEKVYKALPSTGRLSMMGGVTTDKGATIVNGIYLQIDGGPTLQFLRQRSKGTWKVKEI